MSDSTLELLPEHLRGETLSSIYQSIYTSLTRCFLPENIAKYSACVAENEIQQTSSSSGEGHQESLHSDVNERTSACSSKCEHILQKLTGYRYIDELYQLQRGKHIRWIRLPVSENSALTIGGVVVDIKIMDTGVHILCKNGSRYIQFKFDECVIYQKLTTDELLILTALQFTT